MVSSARVVRKKTQPLTERQIGLLISLSLALLALAVLIPIAPHLQTIPETDSSVFLYTGDRILEGAIPYRDAWDHKGPLIYYIDALGLGLSGGSRWGVWILEWVFVSAAALIGFRLISRLFGLWPAIFASLLFLLQLTLVLDHGNLTEEYALPLQFLIVFLFWQFLQSGKRWNWFLLGVVAALSFLLRPNLVGLPLAIGLTLGWQAVAEGNKENWRNLGLMLSGSAAVLASVAVFFQLNGALPDLWNALIVFNLKYAATEKNSLLVSLQTGLQFLPMISLFAVAGWTFLFPSWRSEKKHSGIHRSFLLFLLLGLPIELLLTALSGRSFPHYYMTWLPIFTLLSAFFIYFLGIHFPISQRRELGRAELTRWVALGLLLGFAFLPILQLAPPFFATLRTVLTTGGAPKTDLSDQRLTPILQYVQTNVGTDEPLLVWGHAVAINWLTDRNAPILFVYQTPLFVDGFATADLVAQVIVDLGTDPLVIIDTNLPTGLIPPLATPVDVIPEVLQPLYRYLQENYVFAGTFARTQWPLYLYHGEGVFLDSDDQ